MLIAIITPNTNNIPIIDVAKVKLSSINLFAGLPNSLNKPAKIKKRSPLETKEAIKNIVSHIKNHYGPNYLPAAPIVYKSKSKNIIIQCSLIIGILI